MLRRYTKWLLELSKDFWLPIHLSCGLTQSWREWAQWSSWSIAVYHSLFWLSMQFGAWEQVRQDLLLTMRVSARRPRFFEGRNLGIPTERSGSIPSSSSFLPVWWSLNTYVHWKWVCDIFFEVHAFDTLTFKQGIKLEQSFANAQVDAWYFRKGAFYGLAIVPEILALYTLIFANMAERYSGLSPMKAGDVEEQKQPETAWGQTLHTRLVQLATFS